MQNLADRFDAKFIPEPNSGCWLWVGALFKSGYGAFRKDGKASYAHRVSYELYKKTPIPSGLHLDHLCRVTCCVNPDHLEPVTPGENSGRGNAGLEQSKRTHCPYGHAYDDVNTYRNSSRINRECRACRTKRGLARYAKSGA